MLSKQTPITRGFKYNPFAGAMLHLFSRDNNPAKTRRLSIEEAPGKSDEYYLGACVSASAIYIVRMRRDGGQISVFLVGNDGTQRPVENYSVKFPGKPQKKVFART